MGLSGITGIICSNCKQLLSTGRKDCPACGQLLTGNEVGNVVPVEIRIEGARPDQDEVRRLQSVPFERKPPSSAEKRRGLRYIALGAVLSPLLLAGGLFMVIYSDFFGKVWIGVPLLLAGLCLLFLLIYGFIVLARDGRQKSAENAFDWLWREAYFDDTDFDQDESKNKQFLAYACGSAMRVVPSAISEAVDQGKLMEYLLSIRRLAQETLAERAAQVSLECNVKKDKPFTGEWKKTFQVGGKIDSSRDVAPGLKELTGRIMLTCSKTADVPIMGSSNEYIVKVAQVDFLINGFYIQNGDYWFPYDLRPEVAPKSKAA